MGMCYRWHSGRVRVPGDTIEWLRHAFDNTMSLERDSYDYFLGDKPTACYLNQLRPLRRYQTGFIAVDAEVLSELRNLLDLVLVNDECLCAQYGAAGVYDGGTDPACEWCWCLLNRDRLDYWLDRQDPPTGRKNAYIEDTTPADEAEIEAWFLARTSQP